MQSTRNGATKKREISIQDCTLVQILTRYKVYKPIDEEQNTIAPACKISGRLAQSGVSDLQNKGLQHSNFLHFQLKKLLADYVLVFLALALFIFHNSNRT